jgi:hypothetical protein
MLAVDNEVVKFGRRWRVTELWFPRPGDAYERQSSRPFEIVRGYHGTATPMPLLGRWKRAQTLLSDLEAFPRLRGQLQSSLRRDIDRALERDGATLDGTWSPEAFDDFFRESDPTNPGPVSLARLRSLAGCGRLALRAMKVDGIALCAHAYLEDFPNVLLLHTYTRRKNVDRDSAEYTLISRANKALHYVDMQWYHGRGFREMDWGGFWGKPGYGPDEFKRRFRGRLAAIVSFDTVLLPGRGRVAMQPQPIGQGTVESAD